MSQSASAWIAGTGSIATATVKSVVGARIEVVSSSFGAVSARLAVAGAYRPRAGDGVLVAVAEGAHYVIGVVRALRETEQAITAEDGSSAALERDDEGAVWRLRDSEGRLVFEHREGKSIVHVKDDLELVAGGDLALSAAGEVRIESAEGLRASAQGPVELASAQTEGTSAFRLDGDRGSISARHLSVATERADVKATDVNVVAKTLRTVAHRVRERAEHVERTAGRVVEHAREVFREVEELSQTKAGRLRLVADTALSLLGRSTTVKAREDVKIKGEKIYLA